MFKRPLRADCKPPLLHHVLAERAGQNFLVRAVALEHARDGICINALGSKNAVFAGFPGADATSLDRALTAARRGVELDRANQFAMVALAQTHFQYFAGFGSHASAPTLI